MVDALQIIINMSASLGLILDLINAIAVLMGVLMIATAWYDMYACSLTDRPQSKQQPNPTNIVLRFVAGAVFLTSVLSVQIFGNTILAQPVSSQSFLYQGAGLTAFQKLALKAIFGFFSIAGYIAFLKGWRRIVQESMGVAPPGSDGSGYYHGIWMIIGGVGLVYLDLLVEALSEWTGFDLIKIILF